MKVAVNNDWTHNPVDESHWVSCLRENLTSSSYGEGLETGRASSPVPRQSFTRQLLFKEWKSHANLRAFSTAKPAIIEGLIWAARVVAAVKRYRAHSAQIVAEVATSTLRTAKCAWQVTTAIVEALLRSSLLRRALISSH